jgi:hypothetical protein
MKGKNMKQLKKKRKKMMKKKYSSQRQRRGNLEFMALKSKKKGYNPELQYI